MLRPVRSLPPSSKARRREPYVASDVREFARGGMEVCAVEFDGRRPEAVEACLRKYLKAHPNLGVACVTRAGVPYLVREAGR